MDVLILGGPRFLGVATIDAALAAGHNVTTFNRGQTNPGLYPDIEKLHGDRDGDLGALAGRKWDLVVDNSGYVPRIVRQSAELLADNAGRYVFVSSVSVYRDLDVPGIDESYPVAKLEDETTESIDEAYGGLKALCENVVREVYGDRSLVVRPGLIVGPHDNIWRFPYWLTRVARGGEVLAPVGPDYCWQIIDARDLMEWTLRMAERGEAGVYNATGPDYRLTAGRVLETARAASASDATFAWASEEFLLANKVVPWAELPFWAPSGMHIHEVSIERALMAGLTFRPLEDTVRDTLAWAQSIPVPEPLPAGMTAERETELLAAVHAATSASA